MKATLNGKALAAAIDSIRPPGGPADLTHPGFNLAHFQVRENGKLWLTAGDTLMTTRSMESLEDGYAPGETALMLSTMKELRSVLGGDEQVTIETSDKSMVMIQGGGRGRMAVPVMPAVDCVPFPALEPEAAAAGRQVKKKQIEDIADLVKITKNERDRLVMHGVTLQPDFFEVCDGRRMVRRHIPGLVAKPAVAPREMWDKASSITTEDGVKMMVSDNRVWVRGRSSMFTCRLLDAVPISDQITGLLWSSTDETAMNNAMTMRVPVSRMDIPLSPLKKAMKAILSAAGPVGKAPGVRFRLSEKALSIRVLNPDTLVDLTQHVPCKIRSTGNVAAVMADMCLEASYLEQMASSLVDDVVTFSVLGPNDRTMWTDSVSTGFLMPRLP